MIYYSGFRFLTFLGLEAKISYLCNSEAGASVETPAFSFVFR